MSTQNDNTTVSFFEFLKKHAIQIPVIQRDYVQGRALTDKEKEKRDEFVVKLMDALLPEGKPCHLDFIYGGRESYGDDKVGNSDAPFLPLDGQQRLTTLFLLHWILLQKNAPTADEQIFRERMEELSKFTYKTRISSGRFCQKLAELQVKPDSSLISQIEEKYWYDHDMQSDPTVKAMMQMLSFMEKMLDTKYDSHKQVMLENLYDTSKHCITFDELDMKQYNLTDSLYVKMNARGKELTAFENWKASFTDMIECNDEKERFSYSMEHEWNDVFWRIAYQDYLDNKEKCGEQVPYPRIDEAFMNFFNNITRLLFFIIPENQTLDAKDYKLGLWSTVSSVYKDKESRDTLFNMLDTLHKIDTANANVHQFFGDTFTTDAEDVCKVRLFDDNIDLFEAACSTANFSVNHILLFAILSYCEMHKTFRVNEQLRNYVRFCRNYLYEHNYFDSAEVTISPHVRVSDMAQYKCFFEALLLDPDSLVSLEKLTLKDEYTSREKSKLAYYKNPKIKELIWRLEDLPLTYGNLQAFADVLEKCINDDTYCTKVWNAVKAFIQAPSLTKVQLFIALGYKGIEVRNCAYGKAVFLGSEFRETQRWMVHFRKKYDSPSPLNSWMKAYVEAFSQVNDLDTIVTQQIPADKRSVKYYMLKYPDVLASQVYWRKDLNSAPFYFAMKKPWENLDMITSHSFSNRPLSAYHVCPMANAVVRGSSLFQKYFEGGRMGYAGIHADKGGVVINKSPGDWDNIIFKMTFGEWEWLLPQETYNQLSPSLQKELKPGQDNYELHQTDDKDLVEVAVDFMNTVIEDFEQRGLL